MHVSDIFLRLMFNFELLFSRFTSLSLKYIEAHGHKTPETEILFIFAYLLLRCDIA